MTGNPAWIDNPEFSKALWELAGLKAKPEREDRGVSVDLYAWWDGESFGESPKTGALRCDKLSFYFQAVPRLSTLVLQRLGTEFKGYRLSPFLATFSLFVSQPDRRVYMQGIHTNPGLLVPPQYGIVIDKLEELDLPEAQAYLMEHLQNLRTMMKKLRGWGYAA